MLYLEARFGSRVAHWPVPDHPFVVGRGADCDVVIDDPSLSRRHLRLHARGARVVVEDLNSTNGLIVREARVARAELGFDDWFLAGSVLLALRQGVTLTDSPPPARRPETRDTAADTPGAARRPGVSPDGADVDPIDDAVRRAIAAPHADGAVETLLRLAGRIVRAGGGLLYVVADGLPAVRAATGAPPSPALAAELPAALAAVTAPDVLALDVPVLVLPAPSWAGRSWTVFWPATGGIDLERPQALATLCALVAAAADAPAAPPAARAASPGAAGADDDSEMIAVSEGMRAALAEAERLARTDLPILLGGETGTGKDLLARHIHRRSRRANGPFVAINCAALPAELIESELFGIERGVATGVSARPGRFTLASGGTLFLDEIGDLPERLQPRLLRALESREILPVGGTVPVPADVRIVAATHVNVEEGLRTGALRRDLLHRIAGAHIELPPLRERPEDVLPLARLFARRAAAPLGRVFRGLDTACAAALLGYRWPGNVRELDHAIARAVALSDGSILAASALPPALLQQADRARGDALLGLRGDYRDAKGRFDRLYFTQLLERAGGNLSEAARLADVTRSHLYRKLDQLGMRPPGAAPDEP